MADDFNTSGAADGLSPAPTRPIILKTRQRRVRLWLGTAVVLAGLVWFGLQPRGAGPAEGALVPNGYTDFLEAPGDFEPLLQAPPHDLAEARQYWERYSNAVVRLRLGLAKPCRVSPLTNGLPIILSRAARFEGLARVLWCEAMLAEADGRITDAWRACVDCIQFGHQCAQGGTMYEHETGMRQEVRGLWGLRQYPLPADAREVRRTLDLLGGLDRDRESPDVIARRDRRLGEAGLNNLQVLWTRLAFDGPRQRDEGNFGARYQYTSATLRLGVTATALRFYQRENGRLPGRLDELVPRYLPKVPVDPYRHAPLQYRPAADSFVLYSVGPDGLDQGGKPCARPEGQTELIGDLVW